MTAKMRKKHFRIFIFQKLFVVTITDNTVDGSIECSLLRLRV